jgi:hypothetical protein
MASFRFSDKRAVARAEAAGGVSLGKSPFDSPATRSDNIQRSMSGRGRSENEVAEEMRRNRRASMQRRGSMGGTVNLASGRPKDPMYYWQQANMPYDMNKMEELEKIRAFMRILYITHPVFASATDIFSKYPLVGMELSCKDPKLTDFYTELFFDQLDYEEYLVDVGREYWTVGEAWPYGSWNEDLGIWEDDELLNPDDIDVHRTPFSKEPFFTMRLPESIRDVLRNRDPAWEYQRLVRDYPELLEYQDDRKRMPVSNILLKQLKFKGDTFNKRGIPIGMRTIRAITQEEMMMSAQDAVADRLYTPLILARLGASATDMGTEEPWMPLPEDLDNFEEAIDAALAGDFRLMVHNFAVDIETVFGREQMPNLTQDFERITERILQTWGMSSSMLSGSGSGETYASDALNRDLITQLLGSFQKKLVKFYKERALVVAEAQQHWDTEVRGGRRYPIMEEVYIIDEETGEGRIEEQPKLLIPDLVLQTMNMRSEEQERQFYEALRAEGIPISIQTRLVNVPIDLDDEIEKTGDEQVKMAMADMEVKKKLYLEYKKNNYPVPPDLAELFDGHVANRDAVEAAATPPASPQMADPTNQGQFRIPQIGVDDPINPALAPTQDALSTPPDTPLSDEGADSADGSKDTLPRNKALPLVRNRPEESDEMRRDMPKASKFEAPRHLGTRKLANLSSEVPLDEEVEREP